MGDSRSCRRRRTRGWWDGVRVTRSRRAAYEQRTTRIGNCTHGKSKLPWPWSEGPVPPPTRPPRASHAYCVPRDSLSLSRHIGGGPVDEAALEDGGDLEEG